MTCQPPRPPRPPRPTIGLALAIATAGAVGNLVMMSWQRSAELALDGVVGATPRQQILVPVFEALIITVTASFLGVVMAGAGVSLIPYGLGILLPESSLAMAWGLLGWVVGGCFAVVLAATVVPVLRSLRGRHRRWSRVWSRPERGPGPAPYAAGGRTVPVAARPDVLRVGCRRVGQPGMVAASMTQR